VLIRKLTLAAVSATIALGALPAVAAAADVCNEAENSPRGGYVVTGGPVDPNPPAFLRGSQMRVGDGLVNAAEHSPALRTCSATDGNDSGGGDPAAG
jgi:hypothetical protein